MRMLFCEMTLNGVDASYKCASIQMKRHMKLWLLGKSYPLF